MGQRVRVRAWLYIAAITSLSTVTLALLAKELSGAGVDLGWAAVATVMAVPLVTRLCRTAVHLVLHIILPPPTAVPELNERDRRPYLGVSCVVYPIIVHDVSDIEALVATMDSTRRGNSEELLAHVALVDFSDGAAEHLESDEVLRAEMEARLAAARRDGSGPPLVALYRRRRWNGVLRIWMGWERKRGKLVEFTDLLLGRQTSFRADTPEDQAVIDTLRQAQFVITLDVDSQLAEGGADRLVAVMAHPANRPVLCPTTGTVLSGFGFLRPRHVPGQPRTLFEWAAYRSTSSGAQPSIGQRLFQHDVFLGQGIFDVAAFTATLSGRLPENRVLSHDKLEGLHAGAACVADLTLTDANPRDYLVFRQRCHRWTRGDFHLVPWIIGGPGAARMPLLGRWLLLDDLFFSLRPVSALALLILVWLQAPTAYVGLWTLAVLALLVESVVTQPLLVMVRRPSRSEAPMSPRQWVRARIVARLALAARFIHVELVRWPVWVALLADHALLVVDAACRALYRTFVSKRNILQWTSFARSTRLAKHDWYVWWRDMWFAPVLAVTLFVVLLTSHPAALPWAAPFLLIWLLSPYLAFWTSGSRQLAELPD